MCIHVGLDGQALPNEVFTQALSTETSRVARGFTKLKARELTLAFGGESESICK